MAEEKFDESTTDDQRVLNTLLQKVRGLSAISSALPLAEATTKDDSDFDY